MTAERVLEEIRNQLRAHLESFWPGAVTAFASIDSRLALAFYARYPTPELAGVFTEARLRQFLRRQRYNGRRPTGVMLAGLRCAPVASLGSLESASKATVVRAFASTLQCLVDETSRLGKAIHAALDDHPDAQIVTSFPRSGRIHAAQVLAELGDDRARFERASSPRASLPPKPVPRPLRAPRESNFPSSFAWPATSGFAERS